MHRKSNPPENKVHRKSNPPENKVHRKSNPPENKVHPQGASCNDEKSVACSEQSAARRGQFIRRTLANRNHIYLQPETTSICKPELYIFANWRLRLSHLFIFHSRNDCTVMSFSLVCVCDLHAYLYFMAVPYTITSAEPCINEAEP